MNKNLITAEELKTFEEYDNFEKYENKKALFNTKIASDMRHNEEIVEVLGVLKGRDEDHDAYIVRFNDDTIEKNVMNYELKFDFIRDKAYEETRRILSKIMKSYELTDKEAEELLNASYNYDYEANDGTVFTTVDSIERLFTEEDSEVRINPTDKQLKAMAEYIRETEDYYMLYGYEEYTSKVIETILNKEENKNKTRTLDNGIYVIDLGYRNEQPVALVERRAGEYKEYVIGIDYQITDNKMSWGYGYYYGNNLDKAKEDFKTVLAGGNLADTFSINKEDIFDTREYYAFVLGYDLLNEMLKSSNISECDLSYKSCYKFAGEYLKSKEYENTKISGYEGLQNWVDKHIGEIKSELGIEGKKEIKKQNKHKDRGAR